MKRSMILAAALCSLLISASLAWSIPLSVVGLEDSVIASTNLGNSGDASESAWIRTVLNDDAAQIGTRYEGGSMNWQQVDFNPSLYAINFGSDNVSYFLVKLGNVGPGSNPSTVPDTFLFLNQASMAWGVINLATMAPGYEFDIYKISHVSSVPEPATLLLLGLGLMGIGVTTRRKL